MEYERTMYCDIVECCEMCPRYGDDCDGWFADDCEVTEDDGDR